MKVTLTKFPIYTEKDGEEVETLYDIECDLTPYDPGFISGPPEKCYPPEGGECEIVSVKLNGKEVPEELWKTIGLDERHIEEIENEAFEKVDCRNDDPPDPRED